jgi:hypothetical protein
METIIKTIKDLAEAGDLHDVECCVNYDDSRSCDVGTLELGCCDNMKFFKNYSEQLVSAVFEYASHDIFDNEEQRVAGLKMYLDDFKEKLKEAGV